MTEVTDYDEDLLCKNQAITDIPRYTLKPNNIKIQLVVNVYENKFHKAAFINVYTCHIRLYELFYAHGKRSFSKL